MESVVQKFISFVFLLFPGNCFYSSENNSEDSSETRNIGPLQCFPDVDYYMHTS